MKIATLAIIKKNDRLLLGYKKRGFAKGVLNGPGGKKENNETLRDCIIRETYEELKIKIKDARLAAILEFFSDNNNDWNVFVYFVSNFSGIPQETEEIKPRWVNINRIPYGEMWDDDKIWLPLLLAGNKIHAVFYYEKNKLINYKIEEKI